MEDILETFKNGQLEVEKDVIDLLLSMLDAIAHIVRDISAGKEESEGIEKQFTERVAEVLARAKVLGTEPEFGLEEDYKTVEVSPAIAAEIEVAAEQPVALAEAVKPQTPVPEHKDTAVPVDAPKTRPKSRPAREKTISSTFSATS